MADCSAAAEAVPLEMAGSSQGSVELDILQLTQRWQAQRTIRNGDTPGQALRKGPRPALASLCANVAASPSADTVNPFSFTAQRKKVASRGCQQPQHAQQPQQQQQQQMVRFAVNGSPSRQQQAAPAAAPADENLPSAAATIAGWAAGAGGTPGSAMGPATLSRAAALQATGGVAAGSPSPYVLFKGRLSFAAEIESARKFDRPTTAHKSGPAAGAGLKRKLLISPGADISAAFPTLRKPSTRQRRHSLSDPGPSWAARGAHAEAEEASAAAAASGRAEAEAGGQEVYWSDPLPMPQGGAGGSAAAARAGAGAAHPGLLPAAGDDTMQDTACSPASSGGAPFSPTGGGAMDTCCRASQVPAFSPLPGALAQALPTVDHPDCGFPTITPATMRDLLTHGAAAFGLTDFVVVDCRYEYEHAGGRVPGALHLTTPEELADLLAGPPCRPDYWERTALIFHCEFSTERGPRAAKHVRNKDREAHLLDYPALSHPHVFVLQGGYKAFWKSFPELCEGGYTPMDHPDYSQQLKACHNAVKRAWAKTTRSYNRQQPKRRPNYRLRRSSGCGGEQEGFAGEAAAAVAAVAEAERALPPAVVAAQHAAATPT